MNEHQPEEYVYYRLKLSKETMRDVELLIANNRWNAAINRMYYACFYAVTAILFQNNIETSSHSGVRNQFGMHYGKNGQIPLEIIKFYTKLFEIRSKNDYNDFFDTTEELVMECYPQAVALIAEIENVILKEKK